jgi:hypothetical protein
VQPFSASGFSVLIHAGSLPRLREEFSRDKKFSVLKRTFS